MKTLKAFVAQSNIPEQLIRNVVKEVGGWSTFKESASDIAQYGASGGVGGFIYYTDTVPFFTANRSYIKQLAKDQASDFGNGSLYEMIAGFGGADGYGIDDIVETFAQSTDDIFASDLTQIANLLAWYALEEVSRCYVDLTENN